MTAQKNPKGLADSISDSMRPMRQKPSMARQKRAGCKL
jgi:hypothetical protein